MFANELTRERDLKPAPQYETIIVTTHGKVGLITLNRPKQLNALNDALMNELGDALAAFEQDEGIGAIVITGNEKAFAAGADIGAMKDWTYMDVYKSDYITRNWEQIRSVRKPVIAAVAGFALGGGCEVALACDIVIAADTAKFGQPEIKLGIIPGIGGTQRLPRAVGKAKAMDLILTGRMMDAAEAERAGLVSRVVPAASLVDEAMKLAETVAAMSLPSLIAAKEAVTKALGLSRGFGLREVEVVAGEPPTVRLTGRVAEVAGGDRLEISLTHSRDFAAAVAIVGTDR